MTSNYFKVVSVVDSEGKKKLVSDQFFFDDRSPGQVRVAHDAAVAELSVQPDRTISVYRRPKIGGPWDEVPIVGAGIGTLETEPN